MQTPRDWNREFLGPPALGTTYFRTSPRVAVFPEDEDAQ